MTWVFVFLGEFGYELLNWQGVVRKFSRTLSSGDRVVVAGRAELEPLYETASRYLDISQLPEFRESVASGYFARERARPGLRSPSNLVFDRRLRAAIRAYVDEDAPEFVFSSSRSELRGCRFGASRWRWGRDPDEGAIYDRLDLSNNEFARLAVDESGRDDLEGELGFRLDEPYVLCQMREREIVRRSSDRVEKEVLISRLAARMPVVLLSFDTGRALDSYSSFGDIAGCRRYTAHGFRAQSILVSHAKRCVFFTEGDFGSHVYVPPFLGRDVHVVAPGSLYELGTTPIDFWNANVFRFGGQIVPHRAEELNVEALVDELAG